MGVAGAEVSAMPAGKQASRTQQSAFAIAREPSAAASV